MKQLFLMGLLLCLSMAACKETQTTSTPPANLLGKEQMVAILAEIHLAESVVGSSGLAFHESLSRYDKYERFIFQKHQTDSSTFRSSYRFYMQNPDLMEEIFSIVMDSLKAQKGRKMEEAAKKNYIQSSETTINTLEDE